MTRFLRRIAVFILAAGVAIAVPGAGRAQSDNQPIVYHGVEFPAQFAEGQRISTRDYEPTNPGLGFSAGYRHRGAVSTVYIYDAKVSPIPDDIRAPVVLQQFEQAKGDIRRGQPEGAILTSKGAFVIADANGRSRLACEGFSLKRSSADRPFDTYLCLGVANKKFFKVRTTMPQDEASQREVRRFVGAWAAKLWK
ncbi:MAG: hypothetical protein HY244_01835 [Rhizobiales bacterium]|nr:hypothetical protein [Hyphomicrobiales bacterium]